MIAMAYSTSQTWTIGDSMSEKYERHGDASAVFDCLKYHASAGGEYEYRGTLALEAFDRICTTLLDLKAQRDELLAALQMALADHMTEAYLHPLRDGTVEAIRCAIANAENPPCD